MNLHDDPLENELRRLAPAAPSPRLAAAIDHALRVEARPPLVPRGSRSLWVSWSLTAAATVVAAMAWWPEPGGDAVAPPEGGSAENRVVPVGTSNVLFGAQDEGLVVLADGRPARKVRLQYVDTVRFQDADARADIAVSRPREEIRFVPVDFH